MTQIVEAIYENGLLRPLEAIHLSEHEKVRVTIEGLPKGDETNSTTDSATDPLYGFRFSLGIPDFSENFNDYRFGRRKQ
jgi:predicted DNA-binding antitoxin AbrB/MazE fold protein